MARTFLFDADKIAARENVCYNADLASKPKKPAKKKTRPQGRSPEAGGQLAREHPQIVSGEETGVGMAEGVILWVWR